MCVCVVRWVTHVDHLGTQVTRNQVLQLCPAPVPCSFASLPPPRAWPFPELLQ